MCCWCRAATSPASGKLSPPSSPMKLVRKPSTLATEESLAAKTARLRGMGLSSSQLAIFVDCTSSNLRTGRSSFAGRCLHDVSDPSRPNPYEQVMRLVAETMALAHRFAAGPRLAHRYIKRNLNTAEKGVLSDSWTRKPWA